MSPQIEVKQGILEGKQCKDFFGRTYYSFQGIPFAKPPLGNLRFKAPLPPEAWTSVRDATKEKEGCFCYDFLEKGFTGKEDCLYLNIYTPQLPNDHGFSQKSVMVFIHGGGFISGSATERIYGPKYLLTQDVVLVTITYRLGALGFLTLQDESLEVPGNAGLKDQVMALKWVQENIQSFGGNPDDVTIFGESAGGASVHYLIMSPMAKGLFHKAIIQSGTILDHWASGKSTGMEFSYYMNIEPKDEREFFKMLQEAPIEDILSGQLSMKDFVNQNFPRPFAPVVEKPNKNAFLDENPVDMLIQGRYNKVPIIIGYTSMEGLLCKFIPVVEYIDDNLENLIPRTMRVEKGSFLSITIAKKIKEFYFPGETKVEGDPLYNLFTDTIFLKGVYASTKYISSTSSQPVYLYRFSMDGHLNILKEMFKINVPGACHGDELGYLFSNAMKKEVLKDSKEYKVIMVMIRFWTNFAKMGNPNGKGSEEFINIEWKPVKKDVLNFMDIDFELKSGVGPNKERMHLWDEIFAMKFPTKKY